jgi:hypothetical protein
MVSLVILAVTRIVLVIFNPARKEKLSGVLSSIAIFFPILILFKNQDYYFGPTPLPVKIFVIVIFFAFCILISFANYNEYKDYKEYEVFFKIFSKRSKQKK